MPFREVPDWDPEPELDEWFCAGCRRGHGCNGDPQCAGRESMVFRPRPNNKLEEPDARF